MVRTKYAQTYTMDLMQELGKICCGWVYSMEIWRCNECWILVLRESLIWISNKKEHFKLKEVIFLCLKPLKRMTIYTNIF